MELKEFKVTLTYDQSKLSRKNGEMNKYQLKKLINELDDIRGRNTELVSLYFQQGMTWGKYPISLLQNLQKLKTSSQSIPERMFRQQLDKIGRKVKEEPTTPENGVVFFSGNVSDTEGRPDIQIWEVVPPQPIESRRYRCDKEFILESL